MNFVASRVAPWLLAGLAAVGCKSGSSPSSDGGGGGSGGGSIDMAQTGPVLEPNPPKLAALTLTSYQFTMFEDTEAAAAFSTYGGSDGGPCTVAPAGACQLRSCPRDADMGGGIAASVPRTFVGAGTVTLTTPAGAMPLMFSSMNGMYSLALPKGSAWSGGESYTFSATGDVVPPFTVALMAPGRPRMLTPPRPGANQPNPTVTRAVGLPVTWKPASPGTIAIVVNGDMPDAFLTVKCTTAASAGSYTVPPEALAAIPAAAVNTGVTADVSTTATTTAADWPVTFTADAVPDDDAANLPWILGITLQ